MKVELSDDDIRRIVKSLMHEYHYLRSQQRDDNEYQNLAERMKKHIE